MTAAELYSVTVALDEILRRDLPVIVAIPAAQARKRAAEAYKPFGDKVKVLRDEYADADGKVPDAQQPAFEMRAEKTLAEEVCVDLPTVPVPPMLMLPGATVAVLVEAGVMEVLG